MAGQPGRSGGARVRSGPAPDPKALRRDRDASEWTRIPAARSGPAPAWPLSRATRREAAIWAKEWTRPQAVMWEAYGQVLEVAMYVRNLVAAEKPDGTTSSRTLLMRQQDALGLTTAGLRANRWIIAADGIPQPTETDEAPTVPPRRPPRGGTARTRLLGVIDGGA